MALVRLAVSPPNSHSALGDDLQESLDSNRQVAYTRARRVKDSVGDGGSYPDERDFAEAFHTNRVNVRVVLFNHLCFDLLYVEIHGYEIIGHMCVNGTPIAPIEYGALHQSHPNTADHAADTLACRKAWVEDATDSVGAKR